VSWRFLTNHGRVLLCLAHDPGLRIRDLALVLGITERSTQKILGDLVKAGYVTRRRVGRRNEYEVHVETPLPVGRELNVDHLIHTFSVEGDLDATVLGSAAGQRLH
jgi:DNA-binding transcriptional ArsR family regulator